MYNKVDVRFFCWGMFFFSPVLNIASCIVMLLNRVRVSYLSLSFSIALVYMYFPLLWDVKNNFYRINIRPEDGLNFYTYLIYALINYFGLPFYVAFFLLTALLVSIVAILLGKEVDDIRTSKSYFYFAITLALYFSIFEYRQVVDLQKTTLALVVFLLFFHVNNSWHKVFLLFLSVFVHPFVLLLICCGIFVRYFHSRYLYIFFLMASLLFGMFFYESAITVIAKAQSIFPERVVGYMLAEPSRFSSQLVAYFVKYLRVLTLLVIACIFLGCQYFEEYSARFVVFVCCLAMLFSFNEVFLERLYLAAVVIAIYFSIKIRIDVKHLFVVAFFILVNSSIHGFYTMKVVFSDSHYPVVQSHDGKVDIFERIFYYPTVVLFCMDSLGYSDRFILNNARE